jgi:predicted ATP-grasp superfamily ATP-dependent carboligase
MTTASNASVAIINNDWAPTLAFAVSLGRRNVELDFYGPGVGRWSRYCRRHRPCPPPEQADRFLPWLQGRLRSGEIQRIAPTTDLLAYYLALLRDEFPAQVQRAITPMAEIVRCLIKTQFSTACTAIGQPVPTAATPDDPDAAVIAARAMGYPLIVKPKSHLVVGSGKRGELVQNESQLRRVYRRYPVMPGQRLVAEQLPELQWPLLQAYIPSARRSVYSVSGIKDASGGILASLLTCKREQWPPDIGVSTSQTVCNDARILQAGLKTVDELLSCGIFELELLSDGSNLLAIDLNPRAFGFVALDMAVGNDLPWLWWQTTIDAVQAGARNEVRPPLECRFIVPYYTAHVIRRLLGPHAKSDDANQTEDRAPWISMVGSRSDPIPMLLAQLRILKLIPHPRGLVRPYLAEAWRAFSDRNTDPAS